MNAPTSNKRYPGVKPFETADRALFFGRDRDIEDMLDLIWLEKLIVLFGKSGYGKSSLINAGLLPEIEGDAVPLVVRFGSYMAGQAMPLEHLRRKIEEVLSSNPDAAFLEKLGLPPNLWLLLKTKQHRRQRRFVLIFDQFEEFFTYPIPEQQAFKEQLAELLYTEVPQNVRNINDVFSEPQQTFIATPFEAKVLLSIRADRMSLLDSMKDKLPAILQKRYELKGLTEGQARQAIEAPAKMIGNFASPPFTYSENALRVMTQKLAETKAAQRSGIEAFQLQILCEYLEDKIIKNEIPKQHIEPQYFENKINDIYEGYYERLIQKLDPALQHAAQLLIEEKLIFADEKTGEARRLSVDSGVLMHHSDINQALLNQLESNFLLRREATSTGGFNYEVTHDTMIAPILKTKAERKAQELALQLESEAKQKRRKLLIIIILVAIVIAALIALGVYWKHLLDNARHERDRAEALQKKSEKLYKEIKEIQDEKDLQEFKIMVQNAQGVLKGGNCPTHKMYARMQEYKLSLNADTALQRQIQIIENEAVKRKCYY